MAHREGKGTQKKGSPGGNRVAASWFSTGLLLVPAEALQFKSYTVRVEMGCLRLADVAGNVSWPDSVLLTRPQAQFKITYCLANPCRNSYKFNGSLHKFP
jgi:hypothetical protein